MASGVPPGEGIGTRTGITGWQRGAQNRGYPGCCDRCWKPSKECSTTSRALPGTSSPPPCTSACMLPVNQIALTHETLSFSSLNLTFPLINESVEAASWCAGDCLRWLRARLRSPGLPGGARLLQGLGKAASSNGSWEALSHPSKADPSDCHLWTPPGSSSHPTQPQNLLGSLEKKKRHPDPAPVAVIDRTAERPTQALPSPHQRQLPVRLHELRGSLAPPVPQQVTQGTRSGNWTSVVTSRSLSCRSLPGAGLGLSGSDR